MSTTNFNINKLVRPNIAAMQAYSSARDEFKEMDTQMIFLDANENPFENGVNRYPDPQQRDLKELLSKQRTVALNNIVLGNGSDEVLDLLFRAFCVPGRDNVISLPPTYGMYKVLSATNDIENREVVLLKDTFQPNVTAILKTVDEYTKMVFICSPNNPTGNLISTAAILALLENFNGLVVIDEAYIDFAAAESWITQLENYPNLVVIQTMSKAYGLAGVRLGILYASPDITRIINKMKPPYNVNTLTQEKAYTRLKAVEEVTLEIYRIVQAKAFLYQSLKNISCIKKVFPSNANFLLCEVDDANKRYKQLIDKGVVIRNRSSQILCENTLRFTIGTKQENKILLETLKNIA